MTQSHDSVQLRERVHEDPSPDIVRYLNAPSLAREKVDAFDPQMQIHFAHTVMLARQNIIARDEARGILGALRSIDEAGAAGLVADSGLEDLYSHIERDLIRRIGSDVGGRMHTGRSRNDLGVTTSRMILRNQTLELIDQLVGFLGVLLDLSEKHVRTVMPGLTHSQHAQVITLGYYFAALASVVGRDLDRLEAAYGRINRNPLGAAALTTTGFPLDRQLTTELLGFEGLVVNGYDAIVSRDDVTETAAVVALLMTNASRLAEDIWMWCTLEFGYVELADRYCAVSSIMPQKKNPGVIEKIKALSAEAVGASMTAFAAVKNVSFSECGDAQAGANVPLGHAVQCAIVVLDLYKGVLSTMTVNQERLAHLAAIGFATMTELADTIVREKGLSFRMAHNIVGKTVVYLIEEKKSAVELTTEMLDQSSQDLFGTSLGLSPESVARALDPWGNIEVRTVAGGPAPGEMHRMIGLQRKHLAAALTRQAGRRAAIAAARSNLKSTVAELMI